MTKHSLRMGLLALAAIAAFFSGASPASAQNVSIRIGTPPPPPVYERPWAPPYRTAVWIPGHHEYIYNSWIWVRGYYTYPSRRGDRWISARWRSGYYYPGHWAF